MTPPSGWLCDCQRPVVLNGATHLYYLHAQTNAGPGGWDVCTTEDLVAFGGNRVAIPMEDGVPVWTGSAVLSCTGWGGLCFRVGFFVGIVGVGWSFRGTKAAVGSGG